MCRTTFVGVLSATIINFRVYLQRTNPKGTIDIVISKCFDNYLSVNLFRCQHLATSRGFTLFFQPLFPQFFRPLTPSFPSPPSAPFICFSFPLPFLGENYSKPVACHTRNSTKQMLINDRLCVYSAEFRNEIRFVEVE